MNRLIQELEALCQDQGGVPPPDYRLFTMKTVYKIWGQEILTMVKSAVRQERNNTLEEIAVHCDFRAVAHEVGRFDSHRLEAENLAAKIRSMKT